MSPAMKTPVGKPPSLESIREALVSVLRRAGACKAIVFGSYARGEADEYSDLDLIVIAETDLPFFKRHERFAGIYDVWRKGLDLLIYTPEELEQMQAEGRPFIQRALQEGVVIYEEQ